MATEGKLQPLNVLFVCVGNSCRSQMAEALANHLGQGRVRAWSAGSHPLGEIVPLTFDVLKEKGISLDGQWSKGLKDVPVAEMDIVVGMGCEVVCPVPVGFKGRVIEWNIPDPYGREIESYRSVRDLIERQVAALLEVLDRSAEDATGDRKWEVGKSELRTQKSKSKNQKAKGKEEKAKG